MEHIDCRHRGPAARGFLKKAALSRGLQTDDINLKHEVGLTAGEVYKFVESRRETYMRDLSGELHQNGPLLMLAVGWLLREDKLEIEASAQGVKVKVK